MYAAVCAWSWAVVDFAGSEAIRVEPANTWPGRIAHRTNLPFPKLENGGDTSRRSLTAWCTSPARAFPPSQRRNRHNEGAFRRGYSHEH
jgi:hypothetical protein